MKLCLPLLPVQHPGLHPSLLRGDPPRTPFPHRKPLESGNTKPTRTPTGNRPPARVLDFDYDDEEGNKENAPPEHPTVEDEDTVVQSLLKKWAQELDQYRHKVLRDLDDCRRRLGIHQ
uniref:E4 protein n=1 Tax=Human papillomavirus TaxID=10566 RepID=A0A385PMJ0_9PAPI|nr:MAG: E4 protein [Human papillomavirus]